jgi:hypothetical protein
VVSGVIDTADQQKSRFNIRISPQIRSHMLRGSGAKMELFDEKTRGRKSRDTVPLILTHFSVILKIINFNV